MDRYGRCCFIVAILAATWSADTAIRGNRAASAAPIPTEVKEVVSFIFFADDFDAGQCHPPMPNGTGFFVSVQNEVNPAGTNVYLVTALHVLKDQAGDIQPVIWVRLNTASGGAEYVPLELLTVTGDRRFFTHPEDESIDLAVIPALPNENYFEFKAVPSEMFVSRTAFKELKITEGSEVFFTGLFTGHYGEKRNYPVVRFGEVAEITDEKIPVGNEMPQELYLVETHSMGGNSGSPVFFYLGPEREPGRMVFGGRLLRLAGIMKGTFLEHYPSDVLETRSVAIATSNAGLAAVVPSYFLDDILQSDEARRHRAESVRGLPIPSPSGTRSEAATNR